MPTISQRLTLSLACGPYDRTEALRNGDVQPDGIELIYLPIAAARQTFSRMVKHHAFDVAEMSCAYYLGRRARGDFPFIAIPVFPSRRFRHGFVFVNSESGIASPADLAGKRIGVPEFRVTAAVWIRGILQDEFDVELGDVRWFEGGLNRPAETPAVATTSLAFAMDDPVDIRAIPRDATMSDLLADGELDAVLAPRVPDSLWSSPQVGRLFPDYPSVEREYFRKTGLFPIMHTVVIRESLFREHPWVARSLFRAFVEARDQAWESYHRSGALRTMLPWQYAAVEEVDRLFPADYWPYGLEPNRPELETLMRYLVEQGFLNEGVPIDDLFAPVIAPDG